MIYDGLTGLTNKLAAATVEANEKLSEKVGSRLLCQNSHSSVSSVICLSTSEIDFVPRVTLRNICRIIHQILHVPSSFHLHHNVPVCIKDIEFG